MFRARGLAAAGLFQEFVDLTEIDIRLAGQRLIAAYGTEAWFIAADLAVAAARAGNDSAADLCNRIAQAIEEMGITQYRVQ
ncbi:MAG: hypothetical protein AB7I36_07735 [Rhodospirillaceae bacterium]